MFGIFRNLNTYSHMGAFSIGFLVSSLFSMFMAAAIDNDEVFSATVVSVNKDTDMVTISTVDEQMTFKTSADLIVGENHCFRISYSHAGFPFDVDAGPAGAPCK